MDRDVTMILKIRLQKYNCITPADLRRHVKEAVECWSGSYHPSDPLFDGIERVTTRIQKETPHAKD